eukprot:364433-Chlamydomonas_euryale.AAC.2
MRANKAQLLACERCAPCDARRVGQSRSACLIGAQLVHARRMHAPYGSSHTRFSTASWCAPACSAHACTRVCLPVCLPACMHACMHACLNAWHVHAMIASPASLYHRIPHWQPPKLPPASHRHTRVTQKKKHDDLEQYPECIMHSRRIMEGLRNINIVCSTSVAHTKNVDIAVQLFRTAMNYRHDVLSPGLKVRSGWRNTATVESASVVLGGV